MVVGASYSHASEKQYSADLDPALNVPVNVYRWDPHSVPKPNVGAYSSAGPTKTTQKGLYGMGRIKVIEPVTVIAGYVIAGGMSKHQQQTSLKMAALLLTVV